MTTMLYSQAPNQEKFIACIFGGTRWTCNLNHMSLSQANEWCRKHKVNNNYTTLIPFNCDYSPKFFTKLYVDHKLKKHSKTEFL
ncbi:hypothetical protein Catovirus_2_43 [Catovirus CTV1]|uniref:Uncharacterized protein n=1 Tax=Catovirus CTV1 TaxID=1977631 RepID=A0A1V0SBP4_9VIRU|nr:hypothetical protein Catovirus_2_43 [Catovirus CTV1]